MMNEEMKWHLSANDTQQKVTEFEISLWRIFHAFLRWQEACEQAANELDLTGNELSILHIIRMQDRAKTVLDIGRFLNRVDYLNINYSVSKLLKMGLISKTKGPNNKTKAYQITASGIKDIDRFVKGRTGILIELFSKQRNLNLAELTEGLKTIKALYDEAGQQVAAFKCVDSDAE